MAVGKPCPFLSYRKFLNISCMTRNNDRTAAEQDHAAEAPRRRRRILRAGFFFMFRDARACIRALRENRPRGGRERSFMEERFHIIENYLMIRMPEEIDHHQAAALSRTADQYILQEPVKHIVFDFEDTRFMDSSGVGVVIGRYKKIACFGGRVYAVNADSQIQRIIRVSGLKKVLNVVEEDTDV